MNENVTRFIPAGAGNTPYLSDRTRDNPVHPRWRGEHAKPRRRGGCNTGSSPLARGTLDVLLVAAIADRFIPAGAGNTSRCGACRGYRAVHPRWRGEHGVPQAAARCCAGSSPLARGTRGGDIKIGGARRFIPAGAGNTLCRLSDTVLLPVHPRWRGEHVFSLSRARLVCGSSPLARGTRPVLMPAWSSSPVHPRWRGEHAPRPGISRRITGSSPLARGTREISPEQLDQLRFIPAGAGNTC